MPEPDSRRSAARSAWLPASVRGWLIAGTIDISYAIGFSYLRSGVPPSRILQSVASGLLGAGAYQGGARVAALGLALHYLNALIVTIIFFAVAARATALVRKPLVTGALFGLVVYIVMNYVVIPLSAIGVVPKPPAAIWVTGVLVHMFGIGWPIAAAARRGLHPGTR